MAMELVTATRQDWRVFLFFCCDGILPAHVNEASHADGSGLGN